MNDVLKPVPVGIKDFLFFKIYDRWGKMVFYTTNYNKGWDGYISNIKPILNSFVWVAEGKDAAGKLVMRKGTVTIIK